MENCIDRIKKKILFDKFKKSMKWTLVKNTVKIILTKQENIILCISPFF